MTLQKIVYSCDGVELTGHLALPAEGAARPVPGVIVAHEAPGMNEHILGRAAALADLGYAAFALDMYGEAFPLPESMERHAALMQAPGLMFRRASAALDVLAGQPAVDPERLAAIGYCQGGITALELARGGASIRCAVGFHPGFVRAAGSADRPITAKVLMMTGDLDPVVSPDDRVAFAVEMTDKGADWQLHIFGGVGHTFTNPAVDALNRPGFAYNAAADRRSWQMMLALLAEEFGPTPR